MRQATSDIFIDGFKFTEGMRWYQDGLWFCDLSDNAIYHVDESAHIIDKIDVDSPVGLGWLSDGRLLITSLYKRQLLQYEAGHLSEYFDLSFAAPGYCHDFTVTTDNTIYLSTSGFYPAYGVKPIRSSIYMLTPERDCKIAAKDLGYPNGIKLTPDERQLFVSETFSATVSMFDIAEDRTLIHQRTWARFDDLGFQVSFDKEGVPEDLTRHYPDGLCYDSKLDLVWVASPGKRQVLMVDKSGSILQIVNTQRMPFDCVLGGDDGRTLFIASSDMSQSQPKGCIEKVMV